MCEKLPYNNPRIDSCIRDLIKAINKEGRNKTLTSCCGHNKYQLTIVVKDRTGKIFEIFSGVELGKRKRNRYYTRDDTGYYYIKEVMK